ncbi:2'-5' RNA ligase family protein [Runella aurantiaca]|uniref:Mutarotase n=1 Tax=Runella aurantiaca TaxID=2282308 RepID=A0A369I9M5_9BACT|nr:mutarotase [Runella aurantiaca]RDB05177.1 mutarotase [Runella aurantiaca]
MDLEQHYHQLWTRSVQQFESGHFEYDPMIDAHVDSRRGITLLARPPLNVRTAIETMLSDLKASEPEQYYYPITDIHLTVLSIISCYENFSLSLIDTAQYAALVQEVIDAQKSFKIQFRGITASPSCLLIQGFPLDNVLKKIRNGLRQRFQNAGLQHSIDKRYAIQTAHSTVVRFRKPFMHPGAFLQKVKTYREVDFGTFDVNELELVFNDWYQKTGIAGVITKYPLK